MILKTYYSVDSYNHMVANSKRNFTVFHHNIRSFYRNSDELFIFLEQLSSKPDVLVLTETWFSREVVVDIDGYSAYHTFRTERRGGGVSVYVKAEFKSVSIPQWTFIGDYYEICSVNVECNRSSFVIYGVYRPPDRCVHRFVDDIKGLFVGSGKNNHVFLVGDVNIDIIKPTPSGEEFLTTCYASSFLPLVNVPTHVTGNVSSCLDHIWYNKLCDVRSGAFDIDITDHYIVFVCLDLQYERDGLFTKYFRDHSATSLHTLSVELESFSARFSEFLDSVPENSDIDHLFNLFIRELYEIYHRICPIRSKRISYNRYLKPWISDDLLSCIRRKHNLYRLYRNGETTFDYYNFYKNQVTNLIRRAKRKYYSNKFESSFSNASATWKTVNSLIGRKRKSTGSLNLLSNNSLLSRPIDVANCFNEYFVNVGKRLDNDIPLSGVHALDFMGERVTDSFFVKPVTGGEVCREINNLKSNSCPLYGIPTHILKCNGRLLCYCVSKLFNISIQTAKFPSPLKISRVTPLFKAGDRTIVSNYRPVSILSDFSKIFEKLMCVQLTSFIESREILCNNQFGFRKNASTSDAIIEFLDTAYQTLNSKRVIISVFLDFSKAFDTVKHDVLLSKMDHMGVRGHALGWFKTYLSGRSQYVSIDEVNSTFSSIDMGVPQGSVLGPLLFLLYINDMYRSSVKLKFVHFADDTTVFHSGIGVDEVISDINTELLNVRDWLHSNRLSLNIGKTSFMIFSDKNEQNTLDVCIAGVNIQRVNVARFLGVVIDEKLNFRQHVCTVAKTVSKSIGVLNRLAYLVPPRIRKMLYYSLVFSRVIYGVVVWGRSGLGNISIMEKLLRRARKCVARSDTGIGVITSDFLTFNYIYEYFTAIKLYKIVKLNHHPYFHELFRSLTPTHGHVTRFRSRDNYNLPHFVKTKCQSSFLFQSINVWNGLTDSTKSSQNLASFKRNLKSELLVRQSAV